MAKFINNLNHAFEGFSTTLQDRLAQLPARDRFALITLGIFLLITSIGCLLWFTHQGAIKQQARVTELKDTITWMQSNAVQFSTQGTELGSANDKIQRLAQQQGLSVQLQDQNGQSQFVVSHQNYAVLANLLTQLAQQSVSIVTLDMQKQPDGLIQLKATVE